MHAAIERTKMNTKFSLMLPAVIICGLPAQAATQEMGDASKGAILAQRICAECHTVENTEISSPNTRAPNFASLAKTPGMTAMALRERLEFPHPTMPNLLLTNEQKDDVVAYLLSLKVNKAGAAP
jgi:mono/diheme cytochrome c family protein